LHGEIQSQYKADPKEFLPVEDWAFRTEKF